MKLLCLSQDDLIGRQIADESRDQRWAAILIQDRQQMRPAIAEHNPDLLLIDVANQDDLDWWSTLGLADHKPVLFINKELTEEFVVRAFECGADGLIPKPLFSRRLLAAQVNAYLRRQSVAASRRVVSRLGLAFDSQRYRVEIDSQAVSLTLTEFRILRELATEAEQVVARKKIQEEVFGKAEVSKRSLDVHVCALRKKFRPFGLDIESVRGLGYRLGPCAR